MEGWLDMLRTQQSLDTLSNCCLVVTIAMFSSGIPECVQMVKTRSTGNVQFLPFLMTCCNCLAWMSYGRLNKNMTLILVNAVGAILQSIYIAVFLSVVSNKKPLIKLSSVTFATLWISHWLIQTVFTHDQSIQVFGTICCGITMLMFASPLAELKTVIMTKSTATLSFPLAFTSFLCGSLWSLYGLAMIDNYVIIPNVMGLATSLIRFYLFHKYPSSPQIASKLSMVM